MRIITTRQPNGRLTTVIYNRQGIEVSRIEDHLYPGEQLEIAARKFRDENPELFDGSILIDTPAESEKKNPDQFGDGKLTTVPEV
jgi:hypothetical protein